MFIPFASSRRGLSLIEVLVGATLGFLILGLLSQLMVSSMRVTEKGGERVGRDQKALLLGERLTRDLRTTTKNGIAVHSATNSLKLSIHPRKLETATIVWEPRVIFYDWDGSRLTSTRLNLPVAPTSAVAPTLAELAALTPDRDGDDLDFQEVLLFEVQLQPDGLVTFEVVFGAPGQSTKLRRTVLLRNGL